MVERVFPKVTRDITTTGEIGTGKRLMRVFTSDLQLVESCPYNPSQTEILLEQIATSFGTELVEAYLNPDNGTKLVRLSKPVILTNGKTGERSLLAMQYTRFSPFYQDTDKIEKILTESNSRVRGKNTERVLENMRKQIKTENGGFWPTVREVTDLCFIPDISLARWRKGFYFAVYKLDRNEGIPEEIAPFTIHEEREFRGKLPDVHITLIREPLFIRGIGFGAVRKDLQPPDSFWVSFPRTASEHQVAVSSARALHPSSILKENPKFEVWGDISPDESREGVMAFFQAYLRKMCIGVTL